MSIDVDTTLAPPAESALVWGANAAADIVFADALDAYLALHSSTTRAVQRDDLVHLVFVSHGAVTLSTAGGSNTIETGQVVILPPDLQFALSGGSAARGTVVAVPVDILRRSATTSAAVHTCLSAHDALWLAPADTVATARAFDTLRTATRVIARASDLAVYSALYAVLDDVARAMQALPGGTTDAGDAAERVATLFVSLIEQHYRSQQPLTAYCDLLGVTERALRRATHRVHGQTPLQMIHARTVVEAKRLLRFTHVSVADIGAALGFDDPAYFNRFFKKAVGDSPRAWRIWRNSL
ncbi:MAG: helix-turn-helix domain-containing protein [Pseudomonadota bacterium]